MEIFLYVLISIFIGYVAYAISALVGGKDTPTTTTQNRAPASETTDTVNKEQKPAVTPAKVTTSKPAPVKSKPAPKKAATASPAKAAATPKKAAAKPSKQATKPTSKPAVKPAAKPETKPASKPAAKKAAPKATGKKVIGFRNPATGEEAKLPSSYPFSKRWIKEALVTEGLLDHIYKNNELDDSANQKKVDEAMDQLKKIDKYVVSE